MNDLTVQQPQQLARQAEPTMLEIIRELAVDPRCEPAKLRELMDLQERAEARAAEREFNVDLAAAMTEMPTIKKDGVKEMGSKGSIPYATYEHLDAVIRPIEQKHGFVRIFTTERLEKPGSLMTVKLLHRGGHSISSTRYMAPDPGPGRNDTQAVGSADSYARRYLTLAIWNIVTVGADDDGKKAHAIHDEQIMKINEMVSECDFTPDQRAKFLQWAGAKSVEDIQTHEFERVMNFLRDKLRKRYGK